MEQLKTYLSGRKKAEFAESIGTSPAYLSQLLSGHRSPSLALMRAIERASGGAVDLNSWSAHDALGEAARAIQEHMPKSTGDALTAVIGGDA